MKRRTIYTATLRKLTVEQIAEAMSTCRLPKRLESLTLDELIKELAA